MPRFINPETVRLSYILSFHSTSYETQCETDTNIKYLPYLVNNQM